MNSEMQNIVHEAGVSEKDIIKYAEHKNSNGNHSIAYDMIISNPPYIPTAEIEGLMEEVRLHDPRMALDGLEDGLYFYRTITRQAKIILPRVAGSYMRSDAAREKMWQLFCGNINLKILR